jgi:hypothetical protein
MFMLYTTRVSKVKTLKVRKIEILPCAVVSTVSHQYGLEACTVYGRTCDVVGFMMSAEPAELVALVEACMKEEQHSVFHFLDSDGNRRIKSHCRIKLQYRIVCLSLQQVYKLSRNFKNGVCSVTDAT